MKAVQIVELTGPRDALRVVNAAEPEASHPMTPGSGVLVDVHAAGVSFPEVLQTRGEYQLKPPLPFIPGSEVRGGARSAPGWHQAGPLPWAGMGVRGSGAWAGWPRWPPPPSTSAARSPTSSTSPRARAS